MDFIHRTFQDYLGAKAAVEEGDFGLLVQRAPDSQWADVIRMAVAHARPRERAELLRGLLARGELRTDLLAMACLEHATEIDPSVREEVNARTRAILPPRTREESQLLIEAGPLVLELLPGPEGLEDDEAQEVIVTAATIGTDAALECVKRFRDHPSPIARAQLAYQWAKFDTDRYTEEVVQHLDTNTNVTLSSPAELRALKALGGRPRTTVSGGFIAEELLDALHPHQVTHLTLADNPDLSDLTFLCDFPVLESLTLEDCPAVTTVAPLGGLLLRHLGVTGRADTGVRTPRGLDCLSHLNSLVLYVPLPPEGLAAFPADAPLTTLVLGQRVLPDFSRLTSWPGLKEIHLQRITDAFAAERWQALTLLGRLETFAFGLAEGETSTGIPPGLQLPQVTALSLLNTGHRSPTEFAEQLRTALPAFPNIRALRLHGLIGGTIDLAPVESLPALQDLRLFHLPPPPTTPSPLPPHLNITLFPRPRT
ncbi:hypothetical protein K2224_08610 [Streptomyces sp. BHT-5-2]|uniref:hypothetical protein n=1 Tax=Streptomyces sp. BHT-5-2 TaxID=2866715 RepID=UPI001C8D19EB|nr:hypothetical protein [Streptomyces sp. BHT-5-2]QZL03262.1 hypothetical protein K2224_08610 [Streptomyces sp. BHT-5-2]